MSVNYHCRVCGLRWSVPPWGDDGRTPIYDFCFCCGVEFGNEDDFLVSLRNFRKIWIEKGAQWDVPEKKPLNWDLETQLKNVPPKFW